MVPTLELIEQLYREEVYRARAMTPEQKLVAGAELFDLGCVFTTAGIRHQNPGMDEQQVLELLRKRMQLGRRLEESD